MSGDQVVIVDYGVGNLFNVQRALRFLGLEAKISNQKKDIEGAAKLLLPGVGAFETGMRHLNEYDLVDVIKNYARSGKPLLGICLGMQLLLTRSEENGVHEGLNLIPGDVTRFQNPGSDQARPFKIPQIGWNALQRPGSAAKNGSASDAWRGTLLDGLGELPFMYFIHSYYVAPRDKATRLANTSYGKNEFCSVIRQGNIVGCQFHPERSGQQGLQILENFVAGRL